MLFFLFALLLCQKVWSSPPHRQLSPNNAPGQMTDQTSIKYPATEAEYMKRRDEMQKSQKEFELPDMQLSEDEYIVDKYMGLLKWNEMVATRESGFPPSLPIQDNMEYIQTTDMYKALLGMPKGGNLHSHEDHQLSKRKLFEIVWACDDFEHLYIEPESYNMDFFINPPTDKTWIQVKDNDKYTIEKILKKNTLVNLMTDEANKRPTDSDLRWKLINPLWLRASTQLIANIQVKKAYLKAILEQSVSEGISYIESRRSFGVDMKLYELDRSGGHSDTNGKKGIDDNYVMEVTLAEEVVHDFKQLNPSFVDFNRISYAVRGLPVFLFESVIENTLRLHQQFPEHVVGFDAVGEEDFGYSTLHFITQYLSLNKDGEFVSKIPLYLHAMETSWPEDLMSATLDDEIVSTLSNSYDTLLLQAKRIGHGKALMKKPYLRKLLKKMKTAVEVCPISNQILGMDVDLRNHFGQMLHREGIPIVLAPDDPGTFGFDNVTLDWYVAYVGWGLALADLKKIAKNSLEYSGMNENQKQGAIEKWGSSWVNWVQDMKTEACGKTYDGTKTTFVRALPSSGPPGTNLHIYGRHFEAGICEGVQCKLGENGVPFKGYYVSHQEIVCKLKIFPDQPQEPLNIFVSLMPGHFEDTKLTFQYMSGGSGSINDV